MFLYLVRPHRTNVSCVRKEFIERIQRNVIKTLVGEPLNFHRKLKEEKEIENFIWQQIYITCKIW